MENVFLEKYEVVKQVRKSKNLSSYLCTHNNKSYIAYVYSNGMDAIKNRVDNVQFKSPFLIQRETYGVEKDSWIEIYPYIHNASLFQATLKEAIPESFVYRTVLPALSATLEEVHQKEYIHGEISPRNLFRKGNEIFISHPKLMITGSLRGYYVPESEPKSQKQFDFYSMGMTLSHLLLGEEKFKSAYQSAKSLNERRILAHVEEDAISPEFRVLIESLIHPDRKQRWGFKEVSEWFKENSHLDSHGEAAESDKSRPVAAQEKPPEPNENVINFLKGFVSQPELLQGILPEWNNIKGYTALILQRMETIGLDIDILSSEVDREVFPDRKLFLITEHLRKEEILCYWKGKAYTSLNDVIAEIKTQFPSVHRDLYDFLISGTFHEIYPKTEFAKKYPKQLDRVLGLKDICQADPVLGYYRWYYLLTFDQSFTCSIGTASSIQDFVELLYEYKDEVNTLAPTLLKNKIFFAWLAQKGYDSSTIEWQKMFAS
ncbi:protein kinase domain-containing protein [Mesobacillus jeotgali]|uniref:protein kinase domain-containing protein n=1 Tax=Mesobacillus jeotgali TaxID=129985 RepID=UPI001CFC5B0C|nr:hypothetical protein [Mesobacillus jeotgali]